MHIPWLDWMHKDNYLIKITVTQTFQETQDPTSISMWTSTALKVWRKAETEVVQTGRM